MAASAKLLQEAGVGALCVDLDGTLVRTDLLLEGMLALVKRSPVYLVLLAWWWTKGKAVLKAEVAARVPVEAKSLPYHDDVLALVSEARAQGHECILATAAPAAYADAVAAHLGLFTKVLASDRSVNLKGRAKLARIQTELGSKPFCYVGDSAADLPLWRAAAAAVVVNATPAVARQARAGGRVAAEFPGRALTPRLVLKAIRVHQWAKNLLVFVPLITAHSLRGLPGLVTAAVAFACFSFTASSVYLVNDLCDMPDDRLHKSKRNRPLASGAMRPKTAMLMAAGLLLAAATAAILLAPARFVEVLAAYFAVTVAYSFRLKRVVLADVFLLAMLYTIRILAGGAAASIPISNWLMAFSMFFFLSLAIAKRFAEVRELEAGRAPGRGYIAEDLQLLGTMGVASGFVATLVFALYIHSERGVSMYHRSDWLWLMCPLILYWLARVWLLAYRGDLHSDPVVFALKDRLSYVLGAAVALIMILSL